MRRQQTAIVNKLGIHARAATRLIDLARTFSCQVRIGRDDDSLVDAKSIMKVLQLGADRGTPIVLVTDGDDEDAAAQALLGLIESRFGEDE